MLILVRHAEAELTSPSGDHQRALSNVGRQQLTALSQWVHQCVADTTQTPALLVSDARRTLETAAPIAEQLGIAVRAEPRIYEASPTSLSVLLDEFSEHATLILVGHNPGISLLAGQLSGRRIGLPVAAGIALDEQFRVIATHRLS